MDDFKKSISSRRKRFLTSNSSPQKIENVRSPIKRSISSLEHTPSKKQNIQQVPSDDPFLTPTKTPIKPWHVTQVLEKTNIEKDKFPLIEQFLEEIGAASEEVLSTMEPKTLLDAAIQFKQKNKGFDLSLGQCSIIIHYSKPQPVVPQLILNTPLKKELRDIFISIAQSTNNNNSMNPSTYGERYNTMKKTFVSKPWFSQCDIPTYTSKKKRISVFSAPPDAHASETATVMPWWKEVINRLPESLPTELTDEHSRPTVGTRKPDLVVWSRSKPHNIFYINALGDVKSRRGENESFTADEKGRIESFLEDFLKLQEHRRKIYGFLTDGCLIQFFLLLRSDASLQFSETPVYYLDGEGGRYLMGLLSNTSQDIPLLTYKEKEIIIEDVLGQGGSSIVYKGIWEKRVIVVKHFKGECKHLLDVELQNLTEVAKLKSRHVTQLIGLSDDKEALLVHPVGEPFVNNPHDIVNPTNRHVMKSTHFEQLINLLKFVHEKLKLSHRDITMNNMFLYNGEIFLNDWGCATMIGEVTSFSGALKLAPNHVLRKMVYHRDLNTPYKVSQADDLEMLVKCLFMRFNYEFFTCPYLTSEPKEILEFWELQLTPPFWKNLVYLARSVNYDEMIIEIKKILV